MAKNLSAAIGMLENVLDAQMNTGRMKCVPKIIRIAGHIWNGPITKRTKRSIRNNMKSNHQLRVEEFMRLAGQAAPTNPTLPSLEVRKLRASLILEEALETIEALGFSVRIDNDTEYDTEVVMGPNLYFDDDYKPDMEGVIDGCCDLKVVTTGTLSALGLPDDLFQEEVDNNNLAKFGPGHSLRSDGKLIKPPDHKPPKIKELLETLK